MVKVQIRYNPYTVKTDVQINGRELDSKKSPLTYVNNKRLQEWIEPKGRWEGIYKELKNNTGDSSIELEFVGTIGDFKDLEYAREKYGSCLKKVDLIHKNKDTAVEIEPYQKLQKLKKLYEKMLNGPIEEFKDADIQKNFETAISSEFRIVVVAPMSSGKSTLINAIVGRDLLPALNQATTAVITEIKVNNQLDDFVIKEACDRQGKVVVKNQKATSTLIEELNSKKDPADPEGKRAFIRQIHLEGPVSGLSSDILNTVFVDTPGGNFALNSEHGKIMDAAINDENKSLILYVFNGTQLGVNDSNIVLQKIANTVQNSVDGKQSRDRFLFVANQMDVFDLQKEPYEKIIKEEILPQLKLNGITEPNLFFTSAKSARLINMFEKGEKMTETEEDDLTLLIKKMSRPGRMLSQYASLNLEDKEKLMKEAKMCMDAAEKSADKEAEEKNKRRAAKLNSGVPAVELAIREYLEKYAVAIKIKRVHDAFMNNVIERRMIANCEKEWTESRESFEAVKAELQKKQDEFDHTKRKKEFRDRVEKIRLDTRPVYEQQAKITQKIDNLRENVEDKVRYEEAEHLCMDFENQIKKIAEKVEIGIDDIINNEIRKSCESIISEYKEYIEKLDLEGAFNVGNFNIKETAAFKAFDIFNADELLQEKYIREEEVNVGYHKEKKKGFTGWVARLFGLESGYIKIEDYKKYNYVMLNQLICDQVTKIQQNFDEEMIEVIKDAEDKVKILKSKAMEKLDGLDQLIQSLLDEISRMLASQKELEKKVKENEEKTAWIKDFVQQVENLLAV